MSASLLASPPRHSISQTDRGWVLRIENEHCSVMQVFNRADSAHRAVDRLLEFFHTMRAPAPSSRRAG